MIELIDKAILYMYSIGLNPSIINLTEEDYKGLKDELKQYQLANILNYLNSKTPFISKIEEYRGIKIQSLSNVCINYLDDNEGPNPYTTQSFIASSNIYKQQQYNNRRISSNHPNELIRKGRMFNLHTMKEIF